MNYFGAIDQGTTSTRFIVFDDKGNIVIQKQQEINQILPNEVSVEHDPEEIWESVINCLSLVDSEFDLSQLDSIGITNQRETTLAWRKSPGEPLHNALVWQDTRTQDICDELKQMEEIKDEFIKTGLPVATYFSLSKILWLIRNVDEVQIAKNENDICFGTVDSWLLFKLTNKHVTDVTNASRTLLMDLNTLTWLDKVLKTLNIPEDSLPIIQPSLTNYGTNEQILKKWKEREENE